jgi:hypothetical protein
VSVSSTTVTTTTDHNHPAIVTTVMEEENIMIITPTTSHAQEHVPTNNMATSSSSPIKKQKTNFGGQYDATKADDDHHLENHKDTTPNATNKEFPTPASPVRKKNLTFSNSGSNTTNPPPPLFLHNNGNENHHKEAVPKIDDVVILTEEVKHCSPFKATTTTTSISFLNEKGNSSSSNNNNTQRKSSTSSSSSSRNNHDSSATTTSLMRRLFEANEIKEKQSIISKPPVLESTTLSTAAARINEFKELLPHQEEPNSASLLERITKKAVLAPKCLCANSLNCQWNFTNSSSITSSTSSNAENNFQKCAGIDSGFNCTNKISRTCALLCPQCVTCQNMMTPHAGHRKNFFFFYVPLYNYGDGFRQLAYPINIS